MQSGKFGLVFSLFDSFTRKCYYAIVRLKLARLFTVIQS